eukprot:jgi/Mesvir1/11634/Mv00036-RA.1
MDWDAPGENDQDELLKHARRSILPLDSKLAHPIAAVSLAILGAILVWLGSSWSFVWGTSVGVFSILLAALILATTFSERARAAGDSVCFILAPRTSTRLVTTLLAILWAYVFLLILIRLVSWDPKESMSFPDACPRSIEIGCTRVALRNPNRDGGIVPPYLNASLSAVQDALLDWAQKVEPRTHVLSRRRLADGTVLIHMRAVTFFMGFADDVFIRLTCQPLAATNNGILGTSQPGGGDQPGLDVRPVNLDATSDSASSVLVEVQSQLRLGKGDLGVNLRRVQRLMLFLQRLVDDKELPEGDCSAGIL